MYELSQRMIRFWRRHVGARIFTLLTTVRLIGLLIAVFVLWGFYEIAGSVLEQKTQSIDIRLLLAIQQWHTPFLDRVMVAVINAGSPSTLLLASLLLAVFLLWRKRRVETVMVAIAGIGAIGLNYLLKNFFARARPEVWQHAVEVNFYSFPSSHAMMSVVGFGIIGYLLAVQIPRWRIAIASATMLLVCAIGFSRLYFGIDWATDIVAGYAAGIIWLFACILSLEIWKRRYRPTLRIKQRPLTSTSSRK